MNANQADFPLRTMGRVLGVSHSGFHDWRHRAPSQLAMDDMVITERIRQVHAESRETYGRPTVRAELTAQGARVAGRRIARLMRRAGLQGISKRRTTTMTTRRDPRERPAGDLVKRRFRAERANPLWVADMTYVPTWAGFIYLAVVFEPGQPAHQLGVRATLRRNGRAPVDGQCGWRVRQRHGRELLRHARVRTDRASQLLIEGRGEGRGIQLHRGLVQPTPTPLSTGLSLTRSVRAPCRRRGV